MFPDDSNNPLQFTDQPRADAAAQADRTADFTPSEAMKATTDHLAETVTPGKTGTDAPESMPLPSVHGYEILGILGRGGMGVVYKARHLALRRTVALKMVLAGRHAGPHELARFRTEAEAVARIQHPNIVQIHEVGDSSGHPYCALEYVEGGTLDGKLKTSSLPFQEAAALVETLARAVQAAHARNVIHRDLKPANVLLSTDGTPKITDFGLARQLDSDSRETQAGAIMGTPSYMAPEQARGSTHDAGPAADIYALGAILYECLTGQPPFHGNSIAETLIMVQTAEPNPPSRLRARVPRDLETICLKAMEKEPLHRYLSASELADDLKRYLADEPIHIRRTGAGERLWRRIRRNPMVAGLLVTILALAIIAGMFATRNQSNPSDGSLAVPPPDTSSEDLLKKVVELDRTEPGWRLDEMDRQRPVIPAAENGGEQIGRFRLAGADMLKKPFWEGSWWSPNLSDRMMELCRLPSDATLAPDDIKTIRAELNRNSSLIPFARKMKDYHRGRFTTALSRDVISTLLPEHQTGLNMVRLLSIDASLQLFDGNRQLAMDNCRAMWSVTQVYLDEPFAIVQLMRISAVRMTLYTMERILALGECSPAELSDLQKLLEDASRLPIYSVMMRGERGVVHYFMSALVSGDMPHQAILDMVGIMNRSELPAAMDIRRMHAWLLDYETEAVAIAKQPPERWPALLASLNEMRKASPLADSQLVKLFTTDIMNEASEKPALAGTYADEVTRHLAELRTAMTALAIERNRLANHAWPKTLEELIPNFLSSLPVDPYTGKTLQFQRTKDGVVVYCVGPDRVDHQGKLSRSRVLLTGTDVGFRLGDVDFRRKAAGN